MAVGFSESGAGGEAASWTWPSFSFPVKWLNPEAVFLVECT